MIPLVGRQYLHNASVLGGTAYSSWYIGLIGADFTVSDGLTLASLLAAAAEFADYDETQRVLFEPYAMGSTSTLINTAGADPEDEQLAKFTLNDTGTIYGAFMTNQPVKSNTTGVLLQVVKFPTAEVITATPKIIRINAGLVLASA